MLHRKDRRKVTYMKFTNTQLKSANTKLVTFKGKYTIQPKSLSVSLLIIFKFFLTALSTN